MRTESHLEERARAHGALADPVRLRIVDRLMVGDASPSELQALLGTSSNLLAHHLHVLERAGLVTRRRSEADRRRSYVSLVAEALSDVWPAARTRVVPRVVFVCTANSARSQLAAALWQRTSSVPVASAGTDPAPRIAPEAVAAARRHGLPLLGPKPRGVDEILHDDDYVVTVCDHAHETLSRDLAPAVATQATHWSIPDPVRAGTIDAFDAAYDELDRRVSRLAPRFTATA